MNIVRGVFDTARHYPKRNALELEGKQYTYSELVTKSCQIAETISKSEDNRSQFVALFAHRSLMAYAGVLGILSAGKAYVPLNPKYPVERTARMLESSGTAIIVVGIECIEPFAAMLPHINKLLSIIVEDETSYEMLLKSMKSNSANITACSRHSIIKDPIDVDKTDPAYLLFTSGSTGDPKGVLVSHGNVYAYAEYVISRYEINEKDRFSQTFDLTFDLSVHDIFVCWCGGACLYCITDKQLLAPARFIKEKKLTMWFSVPSAVMVLSRLGMLKKDSFKALRYSLFCGEPLPVGLVKKWQEAAPFSTIENLYGPTEATIAISHYTWDREKNSNRTKNDIVSIGNVFEGQEACLIDARGTEVRDKKEGELCLSGTQITGGYFNNPKATKEKYIRIAGKGDRIWYKTGDIVERDEDGTLYFLRREDNQIKIRGYRVELQEIDHVVRKCTSVDVVATVAWTTGSNAPQQLATFIFGQCNKENADILECVKRKLPEYMIPNTINFLDEPPLNANGKIDRKILEKHARERHGEY